MVREFYFDEKELKCEKEEMMKLASDKKQQYVSKLHATPCVCLDFRGGGGGGSFSALLLDGR